MNVRAQPAILARVVIVTIITALCCPACGPQEIATEPSPTSSSSRPSLAGISTLHRLTDLPPPSIRFEKLTTEDGLSHSEVNCIVQDDQGFMWFGTLDGLNRYDGYSFTVYRDDPEDPTALQDGFIESLYQDRSGAVWAGTQEGWLARYDRESDQFTQFQVSSHVYAMYEDTHGVFWLGSRDPGLLTFDRDTGDATVVLSGTQFTSIAEDRTGVIWVTSPEEGLFRFDRARDQFTPVDVYYATHTILEDRAGDIWIGTWGGGVGRLDRETEQFTYLRNDPDAPLSLSNDYVSSIYEDSSGTLWVGTSEGGLNRYDRESGRFTRYLTDPGDPHSLSSNEILSIYQDQSGGLWLGHGVGGGISRIAWGVDRFGHYRHVPADPNSLSSHLVTSLHGDQEGVLWIGTFSGLDRWDRSTGLWTNYRNNPTDPDSLVDDSVRSVYVDSTGTLWVGTEGGLDRYDRERDRFIHYESPTVMWMHEGPSGTFWMATKDGLYELDRDRDELILVTEGYAWKIMVLEDQSGVLWVGSSGDGVDLFDPSTGEWHRFDNDPDDPSSLTDNSVESIHQDREGRLWFGTRGGLDLYDPSTESFIHFRESAGLGDDSVTGILEDSQGNLWLSTNRGLSRFDTRTQTFTNYTVGDGLQSDFFWRNSYYQSPEGEMFFGGENGLNAFFPEQIVDNPRIPPIVVTAFSIFNQETNTSLPVDEHIELTYEENFLSFDFAALDFNDPEKNQYAFRMEGVDAVWVQAGTRNHADYPNLAPGEYVFHVIGSNSDGVWNNEGTTVRITIRPPVWGTWWFRTMMLFALVAAVFGGYRLRIRNVEERSRQLEVQVAERTAELQREIEQRLQAEETLRQSELDKAVAAERSRLARDLHDAVTQTLFSASLIAEVLPRMWETNPERARQQLEEVRLLTRGALAEMRSLLMELRPEALAKAKMDDLLQQICRAVTGRTGVPVIVTVEGDWPLPTAVQIALYRIAQEALNNVAKHAEAEHVDVQLLSGTEQVVLSIIDNGLGFDTADTPPDRHGVGIMSERAAAIGARLEVESQPGHGTSVRVTWMADQTLEGGMRYE